MSYTPTARKGSLRRQHHAAMGQSDLFTEAYGGSTPAPTTTPAPSTSTPSKSSSSSTLPVITSQKDITSQFAQSTAPGWAASAQVPGYQQSNAPMYLAIGGGILLLGIIIIASRRPAKATANKRTRRRARRRRS